MSYLQFMIKCLTFFKNQKEKLDSNDFYIHWLSNDEEDIDLYYKSKVKKAIMYLLLLETKNNSNVNIPLLNLLERELSFFDVSLCKTIEKMEEKTLESIKADPYMFDQVCLLQIDELTDEEEKEVIKDLLGEIKNQIPSDWETEQYESAIHNVMEMVSQIIPELFFTENGYKYIDKEYQIDDPRLRDSCYKYLKNNIRYYNSNRIYKIDDNIYNELYETEEDLDELDGYDDQIDNEYDILFLDDDEIRGQIDIYGEDIDNYDILFYSVTLLVVMLRFIKNKQYDKIKRMMEIDDIMTNNYDGYMFNYDKTLIESLYQPKTMDEDYHMEISTSTDSDCYLEFFLSSNKFTERFNIKQLSLIIAYCFDWLDSEPIDKIIKSSDMINNVFSTTDSANKEDKIKTLVRIRKEDSK